MGITGVVLAICMWCWDPVPTAGDYCVYWSTDPTQWCETNRLCFVVLTACDENRCCEDGTVPVEELPDDIVYYVVTARNINGESSTEHGPIQEEPCP